jgi:acid phosphatase (class A)
LWWDEQIQSVVKMKMMLLAFTVLLNLSYAQALTYLSPGSVDLSTFPAPPMNEDSDIQVVLAIQSLRTEQDCRRASLEVDGLAISFFGGWEKANKLVDLQERLFDEVSYFSKILKDKYARPRPFRRDARILTCVKQPRGYSYPSTHAAVAIVAAETYSLLYPEHRDFLMRRAEEIAFNRVIGGVHYPSDILAGQLLGHKVFEALMKSPKFLTEVKLLQSNLLLEEVQPQY